MPELDRPADGKGCEGLGYGHLVMGVVHPSPAIIRLQNELATMGDQQAVDPPRLFALGSLTKPMRVGKHALLSAFLQVQDPHLDAVFTILGPYVYERLLQIGNLLFQLEGDILRAEVRSLRSGSAGDPILRKKIGGQTKDCDGCRRQSMGLLHTWIASNELHFFGSGLSFFGGGSNFSR